MMLALTCPGYGISGGINAHMVLLPGLCSLVNINVSKLLAFAASFVVRSSSVFFLAARHPADIDSVSYRRCPGTDHVIFDDMVSVPLRASTALQSAVLASVLFLSQSGGYRHVVVVSLDCICFRLELLSCLVSKLFVGFWAIPKVQLWSFQLAPRSSAIATFFLPSVFSLGPYLGLVRGW